MTGTGGAGLPYERIVQGSLVVCTRCRDDPARSPVFPSWLLPRHDAWHDGQERAEPEPVLKEAS